MKASYFFLTRLALSICFCVQTCFTITALPPGESVKSEQHAVHLAYELPPSDDGIM